ncbi:ArsR/SmtB family transcription factor [Litorihabitans aurantiacus]|uniref:Transcriptional regulator n=1 Tax=Litorihabitans aurantiacus TaxID=1930061 RepID=A0AA38CUR1_9MICO|nr:metalloregulator ArsR/SmtB family transcription factor [Litorihabitans aurantiacus]GMA32964.1 transcriptional regulator [Litorihabitans aurantiacus]
MHAFDILGDPVRRRVVELVAQGHRGGTEVAAGEIVTAVRAEFGISQPAVSNHLRLLREAGFATSRPDGSRRLYRLVPEALDDVQRWLDEQRRFWSPRLDALETEIARGRRAARTDEGDR